MMCRLGPLWVISGRRRVKPIGNKEQIWRQISIAPTRIGQAHLKASHSFRRVRAPRTALVVPHLVGRRDPRNDPRGGRPEFEPRREEALKSAVRCISFDPQLPRGLILIPIPIKMGGAATASLVCFRRVDAQRRPSMTARHTGRSLAMFARRQSAIA
jgi:hypothetical protein